MSERRSGSSDRVCEVRLKDDESNVVRPETIPEGSILRVFRVPAEYAGMRLDRFMQSQLRNTSRTRAQVIITRGAFSLDGRPLCSSDRVRAEDRIALWRLPFEEDLDFDPLPILFEDAHILVVNKPPLIAVHPTARYHRNTIIKRLEAERPGKFLALIHRIDRETSGILLVAKSLTAERAFKRLLEERTTRGHIAEAVRKTYLAITRGIPESGTIDDPLELDPENSLRVKMRIAAPGSGLDARTDVTLLDARNGYALVSCELHTGRQHQIRIHLANRGCPVVGDKLYGPDERMLARAADGELTDADRELLELPRHALHAHIYRLPHPLTGDEIELIAPLPVDLEQFWAERLPATSTTTQTADPSATR